MTVWIYVDLDHKVGDCAMSALPLRADIASATAKVPKPRLYVRHSGSAAKRQERSCSLDYLAQPPISPYMSAMKAV